MVNYFYGKRGRYHPVRRREKPFILQIGASHSKSWKLVDIVVSSQGSFERPLLIRAVEESGTRCCENPQSIPITSVK